MVDSHNQGVGRGLHGNNHDSRKNYKSIFRAKGMDAVPQEGH